MSDKDPSRFSATKEGIQPLGKLSEKSREMLRKMKEEDEAERKKLRDELKKVGYE